MNSISENHGLSLVSNQDENIYSVGISTGGIAEIRMAKALTIANRLVCFDSTHLMPPFAKI